MLESGPALRLSCDVDDGDRATVWFDEETGLPSSFHLRSEVWGEVSVKARTIGHLDGDPSGLFAFESASAVEPTTSD
jgi:hypothetical protein